MLVSPLFLLDLQPKFDYMIVKVWPPLHIKVNGSFTEWLVLGLMGLLQVP